jgi:hypothetical protein
MFVDFTPCCPCKALTRNYCWLRPGSTSLLPKPSSPTTTFGLHVLDCALRLRALAKPAPGPHFRLSLASGLRSRAQLHL